jgi:hypothetical protein
MSLLFFDSFDHYDTAHLGDKYDAIGGTPQIVTGGRCSTNCLRLDADESVVKGVAATGSTVIVGVAVKNTGGEVLPILFTVEDGPTTMIEINHAADGSIYGRIGLESAFQSIAFVSYGGLLPHGEWHYLEMKILLGDNNTGAVDIQVDGLLVYSTTGITTSPYGNVGWTGISFHRSFFYSPVVFYDDLYIADGDGAAPWNDFLGDVRVEYLRPTANGAVQMWTLGAGPSHWEAVDDGPTPDDDATYISTTSFGDIETNIHENSVLPPGGQVYGVQTSFLCKKDQPGDRLLAPVFRQGGVNHLGDNVAVTQDNYSYSSVVSETNPATSAQWTITEINDSEYGPKVTA